MTLRGGFNSTRDSSHQSLQIHSLIGEGSSASVPFQSHLIVPFDCPQIGVNFSSSAGNPQSQITHFHLRTFLLHLISLSLLNLP